MEEFVRVDLHIHTPASVKCYEGSRIESEYINILKKAVEKQLKIIAITDHNTLHGYKELLRIKQKLEKEFEKALGNNDDLKIHSLEQDLNLYKQVTIIPGVEYETQDCIHLLIIFNPENSIEDIENFLSKSGYSSDPPSKTDDYISNWNLITSLEQLAKFDCICLDAHTDSNKGIYNDTKHEYRIRSMSHDRLDGICYCNESNYDKIKQFLEHNVRRLNQIPLLQFSDAHRIDDIGIRSSWVRMGKYDYENLKKAFSNHLEYISVFEPKISTILNTIKGEPTTIYNETFKEEDYETIRKAICAIINSDGGFCLIGVSKKGIIKGIGDYNEEKFRSVFVKKVLTNIVGDFKYGITNYSLREDKQVFSIRLFPARKLVYMKEDNAVYSVTDHSYSISSVEKTWLIAEKKAISIINEAVSSKIEEMEKVILDIKHTMESITIIDRYHDHSYPLMHYKKKGSLSITYNPKELPKDILQRFWQSFDTEPNNGFGMLRGRYIYLDKEYGIRFPHAYTRLTPILFYQRKYPRVFNIPKNSLIITSTGMSMLVLEESYTFSKNNEPFWVLKESISIDIFKCYVMFLKSSFFLWTMILKFGERPDFLDYDVFQNIKFPLFRMKDSYHKQIIKEIVSLYDSIYKEEINFIESIQGAETKKSGKNEEVDIIRDHNANVDNHYYYSDLLFYTFYGLSDDDISKIERYISSRNYYIPPESVRSDAKNRHKNYLGKRK
ncbi:MAG: putative DNA binding domain-containing protein [Candidatus Cloacimonetes bacterium]|nr:putative DNA binding domain-containing protein [Candidatus Cloacimonadota bacterium]